MPDSTQQVAVPVNDLRAMMSPIMDLVTQRVSSVLASCWYLEGDCVRRFETAFCEFIGCDHAISVANGTDALEIALRSVGVKQGSEVIMVANAGGYSTTATLAIGAQPRYVDIDEDSLLMAPASVSESLTDRTAAVVVTHLYGRVVDVEQIRLAVGPNVPIIEDCAQAHGGKLRGAMVGSCGDAAAFSFYPTKNLGACGDGGMVVTSNAKAADRARQLKQYGWSARYQMEIQGGRNSRMDEVQAAILDVKLPFLDGWNSERIRIAQRYNSVLTNTAFRIYDGNASTEDVCHLFVIQHPDRDRVQKLLAERQIGTAIHYPILDCDQPALAGRFEHQNLPVSRRTQQQILTLPCFPGMENEQICRVTDALNEVASL